MFVKNDEVLKEVIDEKTSRKVLAHDKNIMIVEVSFENGGVGNRHSHIHEQISYVAEGKIEFDLDEKKEILKKGDSVYIPKNVPHSLKAMEKSVIIDVFTPQREDFLK